jgi:hypothetical protein
MEPSILNEISSTTVCNFFYLFSIVYAVIFIGAVIGLLGVFSTGSMMKTVTGKTLSVQLLITALIGGVNMLFTYLVCDRALLAKSAGKEGFFGRK